jgi:hypothetical protein
LDIVEIGGSGTSTLLTFFRNTTTGSSLSFAPKIDVAIQYIGPFVSGDLAGDGKPDFVFGNDPCCFVIIFKTPVIEGFIDMSICFCKICMARLDLSVELLLLVTSTSLTKWHFKY